MSSPKKGSGPFSGSHRVVLIAGAWALAAAGCSARASAPTGCGPVPPGATQSTPSEGCKLSVSPAPLSHFKGVDLYSWVEKDGKLSFALVPGRNTATVFEELKGSRVRSVHLLRNQIAALAPGTEVFWNPRPVPGLELRKPMRALEEQLKADFRRAHATLSP